MPTRIDKKSRMAEWEARIERILLNPPGSDEGFSVATIERDGKATFPGRSNWSIICDEVLDTEFSAVYFARAREELLARGMTDVEIQEMRRFAWLTAGWLNFECAVWDWSGMDEHDINAAIETQHSEGYISKDERDRRVEFLRRYDTGV